MLEHPPRHCLSLLWRHDHQLLMREIDVPLAYIERQLPGRLRAELREQSRGALGGEDIGNVDPSLCFEDFGVRRRSSPELNLICTGMPCRCTGKYYRS